MVEIHHQPALIPLGLETERAFLLFASEQLLAIMVFLDPVKFRNDPEIAGKWSLEIGFGPCQVGTSTVLFDGLEAANAWVAERYRENPSNREYSASGTP